MIILWFSVVLTSTYYQDNSLILNGGGKNILEKALQEISLKKKIKQGEKIVGKEGKQNKPDSQLEEETELKPPTLQAVSTTCVEDYRKATVSKLDVRGKTQKRACWTESFKQFKFKQTEFQELGREEIARCFANHCEEKTV